MSTLVAREMRIATLGTLLVVPTDSAVADLAVVTATVPGKHQAEPLDVCDIHSCRLQG